MQLFEVRKCIQLLYLEEFLKTVANFWIDYIVEMEKS